MKRFNNQTRFCAWLLALAMVCTPPVFPVAQAQEFKLAPDSVFPELDTKVEQEILTFANFVFEHRRKPAAQIEQLAREKFAEWKLTYGTHVDFQIEQIEYVASFGEYEDTVLLPLVAAGGEFVLLISPADKGDERQTLVGDIAVQLRPREEMVDELTRLGAEELKRFEAEAAGQTGGVVKRFLRKVATIASTEQAEREEIVTTTPGNAFVIEIGPGFSAEERFPWSAWAKQFAKALAASRVRATAMRIQPDPRKRGLVTVSLSVRGGFLAGQSSLDFVWEADAAQDIDRGSALRAVTRTVELSSQLPKDRFPLQVLFVEEVPGLAHRRNDALYLPREDVREGSDSRAVVFRYVSEVYRILLQQSVEPPADLFALTNLLAFRAALPLLLHEEDAGSLVMAIGKSDLPLDVLTREQIDTDATLRTRAADPISGVFFTSEYLLRLPPGLREAVKNVSPDILRLLQHLDDAPGEAVLGISADFQGNAMERLQETRRFYPLLLRLASQYFDEPGVGLRFKDAEALRKAVLGAALLGGGLFAAGQISEADRNLPIMAGTVVAGETEALPTPPLDSAAAFVSALGKPVDRVDEYFAVYEVSPGTNLQEALRRHYEHAPMQAIFDGMQCMYGVERHPLIRLPEGAEMRGEQLVWADPKEKGPIRVRLFQGGHEEYWRYAMSLAPRYVSAAVAATAAASAPVVVERPEEVPAAPKPVAEAPEVAPEPPAAPAVAQQPAPAVSPEAFAQAVALAEVLVGEDPFAAERDAQHVLSMEDILGTVQPELTPAGAEDAGVVLGMLRATQTRIQAAENALRAMRDQLHRSTKARFDLGYAFGGGGRFGDAVIFPSIGLTSAPSREVDKAIAKNRVAMLQRHLSDMRSRAALLLIDAYATLRRSEDDLIAAHQGMREVLEGLGEHPSQEERLIAYGALQGHRVRYQQALRDREAALMAVRMVAGLPEDASVAVADVAEALGRGDISASPLVAELRNNTQQVGAVSTPINASVLAAREALLVEERNLARGRPHVRGNLTFFSPIITAFGIDKYQRVDPEMVTRLGEKAHAQVRQAAVETYYTLFEIITARALNGKRVRQYHAAMEELEAQAASLAQGMGEDADAQQEWLRVKAEIQAMERRVEDAQQAVALLDQQLMDWLPEGEELGNSAAWLAGSGGYSWRDLEDFPAEGTDALHELLYSQVLIKLETELVESEMKSEGIDSLMRAAKGALEAARGDYPTDAGNLFASIMQYSAEQGILAVAQENVQAHALEVKLAESHPMTGPTKEMEIAYRQAKLEAAQAQAAGFRISIAEGLAHAVRNIAELNGEIRELEGKIERYEGRDKLYLSQRLARAQEQQLLFGRTLQSLLGMRIGEPYDWSWIDFDAAGEIADRVESEKLILQVQAEGVRENTLRTVAAAEERWNSWGKHGDGDWPDVARISDLPHPDPAVRRAEADSEAQRQLVLMSTRRDRKGKLSPPRFNKALGGQTGQRRRSRTIIPAEHVLAVVTALQSRTLSDVPKLRKTAEGEALAATAEALQAARLRHAQVQAAAQRAEQELQALAQNQLQAKVQMVLSKARKEGLRDPEAPKMAIEGTPKDAGGIVVTPEPFGIPGLMTIEGLDLTPVDPSQRTDLDLGLELRPDELELLPAVRRKIYVLGRSVDLFSEFRDRAVGEDIAEADRRTFAEAEIIAIPIDNLSFADKVQVMAAATLGGRPERFGQLDAWLQMPMEIAELGMRVEGRLGYLYIMPTDTEGRDEAVFRRVGMSRQFRDFFLQGSFLGAESRKHGKWREWTAGVSVPVGGIGEEAEVGYLRRWTSGDKDSDKDFWQTIFLETENLVNTVGTDQLYFQVTMGESTYNVAMAQGGDGDTFTAFNRAMSLQYRMGSNEVYAAVKDTGGEQIYDIIPWNVFFQYEVTPDVSSKGDIRISLPQIPGVEGVDVFYRRERLSEADGGVSQFQQAIFTKMIDVASDLRLMLRTRFAGETGLAHDYIQAELEKHGMELAGATLDVAMGRMHLKVREIGQPSRFMYFRINLEKSFEEAERDSLARQLGLESVHLGFFTGAGDGDWQSYRNLSAGATFRLTDKVTLDIAYRVAEAGSPEAAAHAFDKILSPDAETLDREVAPFDETRAEGVAFTFTADVGDDTTAVLDIAPAFKGDEFALKVEQVSGSRTLFVRWFPKSGTYWIGGIANVLAESERPEPERIPELPEIAEGKTRRDTWTEGDITAFRETVRSSWREVLGNPQTRRRVAESWKEAYRRRVAGSGAMAQDMLEAIFSHPVLKDILENESPEILDKIFFYPRIGTNLDTLGIHLAGEGVTRINIPLPAFLLQRTPVTPDEKILLVRHVRDLILDAITSALAEGRGWKGSKELAAMEAAMADPPVAMPTAMEVGDLRSYVLQAKAAGEALSTRHHQFLVDARGFFENLRRSGVIPAGGYDSYVFGWIERTLAHAHLGVLFGLSAEEIRAYDRDEFLHGSEGQEGLAEALLRLWVEQEEGNRGEGVAAPTIARARRIAKGLASMAWIRLNFGSNLSRGEDTASVFEHNALFNETDQTSLEDLEGGVRVKEEALAEIAKRLDAFERSAEDAGARVLQADLVSAFAEMLAAQGISAPGEAENDARELLEPWFAKFIEMGDQLVGAINLFIQPGVHASADAYTLASGNVELNAWRRADRRIQNQPRWLISIARELFAAGATSEDMAQVLLHEVAQSLLMQSARRPGFRLEMTPAQAGELAGEFRRVFFGGEEAVDRLSARIEETLKVFAEESDVIESRVAARLGQPVAPATRLAGRQGSRPGRLAAFGLALMTGLGLGAEPAAAPATLAQARPAAATQQVEALTPVEGSVGGAGIVAGGILEILAKGGAKNKISRELIDFPTPSGTTGAGQKALAGVMLDDVVTNRVREQSQESLRELVAFQKEPGYRRHVVLDFSFVSRVTTHADKGEEWSHVISRTMEFQNIVEQIRRHAGDQDVVFDIISPYGQEAMDKILALPNMQLAAGQVNLLLAEMDIGQAMEVIRDQERERLDAAGVAFDQDKIDERVVFIINKDWAEHYKVAVHRDEAYQILLGQELTSIARLVVSALNLSNAALAGDKAGYVAALVAWYAANGLDLPEELHPVLADGIFDLPPTPAPGMEGYLQDTEKYAEEVQVHA